MVEITFRRLKTPEELRQAEEVQQAAWGMRTEHPVPVSILRAIQDNGGFALGAFVDFHLVGFTLAFLAWDGQELYQWSHMNAVLPEFRNHRVGFRLKIAQREEVLRQGLAKIRWTFDPLVSRNAHLNVHRLGALPDQYLPHYYGTLDSDVNAGLATDRVRVTWNLNDPEVVRRLQDPGPLGPETVARVEASQVLLKTEPGEAGLRVPQAVEEPGAGFRSGILEIPFDLEALREHQPDCLRPWRQASREAFRACFDLGARVDDFAVVSREHERRAYYLLSPGPTTPPVATDAPPA